VRTVRFDGIRGRTLIDRKKAVLTTPNKVDQALRQSEALRQNGLRGRWEVPNEREARRAKRLLDRLHITNITAKVVQ